MCCSESEKVHLRKNFGKPVQVGGPSQPTRPPQARGCRTLSGPGCPAAAVTCDAEPRSRAGRGCTGPSCPCPCPGPEGELVPPPCWCDRSRGSAPECLEQAVLRAGSWREPMWAHLSPPETAPQGAPEEATRCGRGCRVHTPRGQRGVRWPEPAEVTRGSQGIPACGRGHFAAGQSWAPSLPTHRGLRGLSTWLGIQEQVGRTDAPTSSPPSKQSGCSLSFV